jgi:hypothetical protein
MVTMTPPNFEDAGGFGEASYASQRPSPNLDDRIGLAIERHRQLCGLLAENIPERLRTLELKTATLLGLMIGAGTLGGTIGGALIKLLP